MASRDIHDQMRAKVERIERSRLTAWFAGSGRRRALVVGWVALLVCVPMLALADVPVAPALAGLAAFLLVVVLRRAVRLTADLPDEVLDERQVAARDRAYLYAYRAVASVAPLAIFAVYLAMDMGDYTPTSAHLWAIGWSTLIVAVGAPSAVLAWIEPDQSRARD